MVLPYTRHKKEFRMNTVVILIMWRAPIVLQRLWVKGDSCLYRGNHPSHVRCLLKDKTVKPMGQTGQYLTCRAKPLSTTMARHVGVEIRLGSLELRSTWFPRAEVTVGSLNCTQSESPMTGRLYCGSNNVEGTNNPHRLWVKGNSHL